MFRSVMKVERGQGIAYHFHVSCGHVVRRLVNPKDKSAQDEQQVWCGQCWKQVHPTPDLKSDRAGLVLQALEVLRSNNRLFVERDAIENQILVTAWGLPQTGRSDDQRFFLHEESKDLRWVEYWLRKLEKQGLVRSDLDARGWYKIKSWGLATRPASEQGPLLEGEGI